MSRRGGRGYATAFAAAVQCMSTSVLQRIGVKPLSN